MHSTGRVKSEKLQGCETAVSISCSQKAAKSSWGIRPSK